MAITLLCPNLQCRTVLSVPDKVRGKKVRCSQCNTAFIVPPAPFGSKPGVPKKKGVEAAPSSAEDALSS